MTDKINRTVKCKTHPDAPHGFLRNESHSEDRYVCECEFWEPPDSRLMQAIKETMRDLGINSGGSTDE